MKTAEKVEKQHSLLEAVAFVTIEAFERDTSGEQWEANKSSNWEQLKKLYPDRGLIDLLNVGIDWAKEFEQINADREWDGEWQHELSEFVAKKLKGFQPEDGKYF